MDNGLRRIGGRKLPTAVLDVDLPDLARAVTSVLRGQADTQIFRVQDGGYVRLMGRGVDSIVAQSDWEKILTVIATEALTTSFFPVESGTRVFDRAVQLSVSTVDARDPLYVRVYGLLQQLFKIKVPT